MALNYTPLITIQHFSLINWGTVLSTRSHGLFYWPGISCVHILKGGHFTGKEICSQTIWLMWRIKPPGCDSCFLYSWAFVSLYTLNSNWWWKFLFMKRSDRKAITVYTVNCMKYTFVTKHHHFCMSLLLVKESSKQIHMFWGDPHQQSFSLPPTAGKYMGGKAWCTLARTSSLWATLRVLLQLLSFLVGWDVWFITERPVLLCIHSRQLCFWLGGHLDMASVLESQSCWHTNKVQPNRSWHCWLIIPAYKTNMFVLYCCCLTTRKYYLQFLQGEATSGTNLGVVPDGGTPDLWPQWSSNRTGSNETGLDLTSLSPGERGILVKLQLTVHYSLFSSPGTM